MWQFHRHIHTYFIYLDGIAYEMTRLCRCSKRTNHTNYMRGGSK